MSKEENYIRIIELLIQQGISSRLIYKVWEKRPKNLEKDDELLWFKTELVVRGYVADYIIEEIFQESNIQVYKTTEHEKFGRFTLLGEIGKGSMGKVYRAFDPHLNKDVALKMLIIKSEDVIERFVQEGQIMARMHHQNIVKFYEVNQFENQYYLTMDYISGVTLRDWMNLHRTHWKDIVLSFQKFVMLFIKFI